MNSKSKTENLVKMFDRWVVRGPTEAERAFADRHFDDSYGRQFLAFRAGFLAGKKVKASKVN
jgi:hypothetical protein